MDPRMIHDADQAIAGIRVMARAFAAMFEELREGGMQRSEALGIVEAYARGIGGSQSGKRAE